MDSIFYKLFAVGFLSCLAIQFVVILAAMRMKSIVGMVAVAVAMHGVLTGIGEAKDKEIPGKAMFEAMVGEWKSEGRLTSSISAEVVNLTEKWSGKFTADGKGFIIEGKRDWNGEEQTFRWEYSYNAATDLVGATYTASNLDKDMALEVSVNEVEGFILLRAPVGDEGAEVQIEKRFKRGKLISSKVTLFGSNGQTNMEGETKHKREK